MTAVTEPTLFDTPTAAPVDADTASVLATVATDRIHEDDAARVEAAIEQAAREHGGRVSLNDVRALLHNEHGSTVYPPVIGATVNALKRAGRLVFEDEWEITTGSTTGNNGRAQRAYRWRAP